MELSAVAVENLKEKGLDELPEIIKFDGKVNFVPDSWGEHIGRYDKSTGEYESYFKKDVESGNTEIFDKYKNKCNVIEKHKNVLNRSDCSERQVIDYYIMYDFEQSSKKRPTEIINHVDGYYASNGYYECEYELFFANDGYTRRVVINHTSYNISMYQIMEFITQDTEEIFEDGEIAEDYILYGILERYDEGFKITLFDDIGRDHSIWLEDYNDFLSMIVSIRLLSCKFIKKQKSVK